MSHRRAKKIRKVIGKQTAKFQLRAFKRLYTQHGHMLPTLKEIHRANIHADISQTGQSRGANNL